MDFTASSSSHRLAEYPFGHESLPSQDAETLLSLRASERLGPQTSDAGITPSTTTWRMTDYHEECVIQYLTNDYSV